MKLHEISLNVKEWEVWKINGNQEFGYYFVEKKRRNGYFLEGNIIGINQIGENTFLIYRRSSADEWAIDRYRFKNEEKILEYSHRFENVAFITEDKLIFDYNASLFSKVYSISENREFDDIQHLIDSKNSDANYCRERRINLIKEDENDEYPKYLEVVFAFGGSWCKEYIQILIDPNTFQIVSEAYSTMRERFIKLDEHFTLEKLVVEEAWYVMVINENLSKIYQASKTKDAGEMLNHLL